jgi:hypothetical protein
MNSKPSTPGTASRKQWTTPEILRTLSDAELDQELLSLDPRVFGGTGTFSNGTFRNSVKSDA